MAGITGIKVNIYTLLYKRLTGINRTGDTFISAGIVLVIKKV